MSIGKRILVLFIILVTVISASSCIVRIGPAHSPSDIIDNGNDQGQSTDASAEELRDLVNDLLVSQSYYEYEPGDETDPKAIVLEYHNQTKDDYVYYYDEQEYKRLLEEDVGENQGIGVLVTENTEHHCIEIVAVFPNSPAEKSGLRTGDLIVVIGKGDNAEKCSEIGYETAVSKLQGLKDTYCEFGIVRNGDFNYIYDFSILRSDYKAESVMYNVYAEDNTIGIVKILNFDLTTPEQFKNAMNSLINSGCNKFVYDCRNNPGGNLASISAILSYFLELDDEIIIIEDRAKNTEIQTCRPVAYEDPIYDATCAVSVDEIGMYREYPASVIVNGNTASAAELFTGTFKSYGIATIVGEKTFGKGCMQSIYDLSYFGTEYKHSGALKMTTAYYRPHGMDNYHGIGIMPDEGYEVTLSAEAGAINIYKLLNTEYQSKDNQLTAAVAALSENN